MTTAAPPLLPGPALQTTAPRRRSQSGRERASRSRGPLALLAAVALVSVIALLVSQRGSTHGTMDPQSYDPQGGRALATLLGERGVSVQRLTTTGAVLSRAQGAAAKGQPTTVVVADPIDEGNLAPLRTLPGTTTVVLIAPDRETLAVVQPAVAVGGDVGYGTQQLDCDQPDAVVAGDVEIGGDSYVELAGSAGATGVSCYVGTVFEQRQRGGGAFVDIGSPDALSNAQLAHQGNAALGLGLLGHNRTVLWLVPGPEVTTSGNRSLTDLLPGRLGYAVLQGLIAVALLMLWRARRLGRVVQEPLPVTVRASETVEGQGRLYRAARSRRRAATALRAAALSRMAPTLGIRRDAGTAAIVDAVSARTRRSPTSVTALLYGAEPEDDQALVTLADQLDALEAEVRRS